LQIETEWQEEQNRKINKMISKDKKKLDREVKLLLLGAGESGKSTIAKQMKILHLEGYSNEERLSFRSIIYLNVIDAIRSLIVAARGFRISLNPQNNDAAEKMLNESFSFNNKKGFGPKTLTELKELWKDAGIQQTYLRQNEFQLIDSAAYFLDSINRLADENYIPSDQDILRSRARTTGIIETQFNLQKHVFRIVDVGGQRSERRKWLNCFDDVTAVIFVAALSEYDLKLSEDETTNRMHESLNVFEEVCNSKWLKSTSMILFLNKKDIFQNKIQKIDLNVCFPEYKGGKNYDAGVEFIERKFLEKNENPQKHIYVHHTCATDTDNIRVVFGAAQDILLKKAVGESGLGGI